LLSVNSVTEESQKPYSAEMRFFAEFILSEYEGLRMTQKNNPINYSKSIIPVLIKLSSKV